MFLHRTGARLYHQDRNKVLPLSLSFQSLRLEVEKQSQQWPAMLLLIVLVQPFISFKQRFGCCWSFCSCVAVPKHTHLWQFSTIVMCVSVPDFYYFWGVGIGKKVSLSWPCVFASCTSIFSFSSYKLQSGDILDLWRQNRFWLSKKRAGLLEITKRNLPY